MFLPSKLVEYLGSGNPILGLTPERGASASMIRKANGLVAEPDDIAGIKRSLLQLIQEYALGTLSANRRYPDSIVEEYTQKSAAEKFSEAVGTARAPVEAI